MYKLLTLGGVAISLSAAEASLSTAKCVRSCSRDKCSIETGLSECKTNCGNQTAIFKECMNTYNKSVTFINNTSTDVIFERVNSTGFMGINNVGALKSSAIIYSRDELEWLERTKIFGIQVVTGRQYANNLPKIAACQTPYIPGKHYTVTLSFAQNIYQCAIETR